MIKGTLAIEPFGRALIETLDLDPVYVMLSRAALPDSLQRRWCMAYWCLYHAGAASAVAMAPHFWDTLRAQTREGPRGTERRHFRGTVALRAIDVLATQFPQPETAISWLLSGPPTFQALATRVQAWPMFGTWMAFKVVDMLDRCLGVAVEWGDCTLAFYKEPVAGARLAFPGWTMVQTIAHLQRTFADLLAPPWNDRAVDVPEIETVLCKWKSHQHGHYPLGKDCREIRHALLAQDWGPLAQTLAPLVPSGALQHVAH